QMVPLERFATIAGIPARDFLGEAVLRQIALKTKNAGTELVALLQSGSAYYAAGSAIASMVEAIVHDTRAVVCASVLCKKEYGLGGIFIGVPAVLGAAGVERIVELSLNKEESADFAIAAGHLKTMQRTVDRRLISAEQAKTPAFLLP
ncbi:MAG: hypothetical protein PHC61_13125, partial [Chitinivibrionales bacterium]|nr:hypothetical protein [Chitinivibrionales bacterium]